VGHANNAGHQHRRKIAPIPQAIQGASHL
jgi:hypothetical protein